VTVALAVATVVPGGHPDVIATVLAVAASLALVSGRVGPTVLVASGAAVGILRLVVGI
jgi:hypothetical protein